MNLADELPLAILTMVLGAVLGAVLPPFGDALTNLIFKRKGRSRGLHSAFLLFFAACGIWIIGELFAELFLRTATDSTELSTAIVIASVFAIAAFTFAIGFRHLPRDEGNEATDHRLPRALFFLILGNIIWILGEILEKFTWALWPNGGFLATALSVLFLTIALVVFTKGALDAWHSASSAFKATHEVQASTPINPGDKRP